MNRRKTATNAALLIAIGSIAMLAAPAGWSADRRYSTNRATILAMPSGAQAPPAAPLVSVPYRSWLPKKEKPRVVLLCIHALGFNSKSYDNFGRRMAASGIPTYALDVRGFGQWLDRPEEGKMDFEACFTDVEQGLKTLHKAYPNLPVFLVGESMGGAIAIQAASRYPDLVNGVISAVPSANVRGGAMKSSLVVAFKGLGTPTDKMDMSPVIVDGLTEDPALKDKIHRDPLNNMELSKKDLAQFDRFMSETSDAAPLIARPPALMLVAYKDRLVTPAGSVEIFEKMTTSQKLMVGDGNSEHLMLEEGQMTPEIEWILKGWLREKAALTTVRAGVASQ